MRVMRHAAGEGAAERDLAGEGVVAVAADAKVDQQERRHHDGVAESRRRRPEPILSARRSEPPIRTEMMRPEMRQCLFLLGTNSWRIVPTG